METNLKSKEKQLKSITSVAYILPKKLSRTELEDEGVVTLKELLNSDIPQQKYWAKIIFPERGVTLLAGRAGDLKSFFALYSACCLISGKDILGLRTEKCRVLYIDEENDDIELFRRLGKLSLSMNIDLECEDNLGLLIFKGVKMNMTTGLALLEKCIKEFKPDVIIVDSLIRVFEGDENQSGDVRKVFDVVKVLMKKYNTSWIFLHHVVKNKKRIARDDIRGSSDIVAQMSSVLILNRVDENTFELSQVKHRGSPLPIDSLVFTVNDTKEGGIEIKVKGAAKSNLTVVEVAARDIEAWIIEESKTEFKSGEAYSKFLKKHDRNAIRDALKKVCDKGIIESAGVGKWKRQINCLNY